MSTHDLGPLSSRKFEDYNYRQVAVASEALEDPDPFTLIPTKYTGGDKMYARKPMIPLLEKLDGIARDMGHSVLVVQAYQSRKDKLQKWQNLREVAVKQGRFTGNLTIQQEVEVGEKADMWGSYCNVDPRNPAVTAATVQLHRECPDELEAFAKSRGMEVRNAALLVLSLRASNDQIKLPFDPASGYSVFMSGGHFDFELIDLETDKPAFYGVPADLMDEDLMNRRFFEDDNLYQLQKGRGNGQLASYLQKYNYDRFTREVFELARNNIRRLHTVARRAGLTPWDGAARTFSGHNQYGGKQADLYHHAGDQAHAKKNGHELAVWGLVSELSIDLME